MRRAVLAVAGALDRVLTGADLLFAWLAVAMLTISLLINIVNIAARNLLGTGIPPVFSWTMVLFVWMVFLSFYPVYRRRIDIAVDALVRRLPAAIQAFLRLATDALGIAVMVTIMLEGPRIIQSQVGQIDFVGLQRYTLSLPLLASCFLIALDFFADALHAFAGQMPPHTHPQLEGAGTSLH